MVLKFVLVGFDEVLDFEFLMRVFRILIES
jgi:hypothetical protein